MPFLSIASDVNAVIYRESEQIMMKLVELTLMMQMFVLLLVVVKPLQFF
jgi:hypothetical protein